MLIIGGGVTGTGLARDLALRGVNCIVVEAKDINAGASGANNGLLHSGARYVSNDPVSAQECRDESRIIKALAPDCIEDTGGLFVAVAGDDETYIAEFPRLCAQHNIPVKELHRQEAREMEPALADTIIAAYQVEDAAINPFRLSLENISEAEALGTRLLTHSEVIRFELNGNRIRAVHLRENTGGREFVVQADEVVNAAGPWAKQVADLARIPVPTSYFKGTLLVTQTRVTTKVINRLRTPDDGDIVSPSSTVSLVGTTSVGMDSPSPCHPTISEVNLLVDQASEMLPALANMRYVRAFAGVRPLVAAAEVAEGRSLSRGFVVLGHEAEGIDNFITVAGGKLTTFRLMAEKAADLVCSRLRITEPCRTRTVPLRSSDINQWTEPGLAPRRWLEQQNPKEPLLCECEMVPLSAVDQVIDHLNARGDILTLSAIGLRTRVGRGSCQGAFCGMRTAAHLYERRILNSDQGLSQLKEFLERRWHGLRPVLWGPQLAQEELQEALHCGLFGLEE